jgi:hypothetical protein
MARLLLLVAASASAASPSLGGDSPLSSRFAAPPGDPTGQRDSSAALNAELRRLCNEPPPAALSLVSAGLEGIPRDVTLDLQGGVFRLDSPIVVNSSLKCTGVLHIRGGTLYAGQALAAHGTNHSFLVEVLEYWNGLGVSLTDLNFASNGTGGGLRVDAAHHVHVQSSTFLNFATQGIWGSKLLGEVRKRSFLSHLYIKTIILPRQARDKHRENSKKWPFSCRAMTCSSTTVGLRSAPSRWPSAQRSARSAQRQSSSSFQTRTLPTLSSPAGSRAS